MAVLRQLRATSNHSNISAWIKHISTELRHEVNATNLEQVVSMQPSVCILDAEMASFSLSNSVHFYTSSYCPATQALLHIVGVLNIFTVASITLFPLLRADAAYFAVPRFGCVLQTSQEGDKPNGEDARNT